MDKPPRNSYIATDKSSPAEGSFVYFKDNFGKITKVSTDGLSLTIRGLMEDSLETEYPISDLLTFDGEPAIFASSLKELVEELERRIETRNRAVSASHEAKLLIEARRRIYVVETVEKQLNEARMRAIKLRQKFCRTRALFEILQVLSEPVGKSQYYEYRRQYKKYRGNEEQIAADLRRSTFGKTRISAVTFHFIHTVIMQFWGRGGKFHPLEVYKSATDLLKHTSGMWLDPTKCADELPENILAELVNKNIPVETILNNPDKKPLLSNVKLPCRSWFYKYLGYYTSTPGAGQELYIARFGLKKFEQEYLVFNSYVRNAQKPLQFVVADHLLIDLFIVDEETRDNPYRVWLTAFIDAYSRCVMGIELSEQGPSIETIQAGLRHVIYPKPNYASIGIKLPFVPFGMMQVLSLDNAWGHHAASLENLVRILAGDDENRKIRLQFRPPYLARYGALIERLFRTLSGRIRSRYAEVGAIQSQSYTDVRKAAETACLLYEDLYRIILEEIVTYHNTPHSELNGMTPQQKWLEGLNLDTPQEMMALIKNVPRFTPEIKAAFLRQYPDTRTIRGQGMSLWGYWYNSETLRDLPTKDRGGKLIEYTIRFDSDDVSSVSVFLDSDWVCDIENQSFAEPDGTLLPVSLWELKMLKRAGRELAKSNAEGEPDWWDRYVEQQELKKRRRDEKHRMVRKLQKDADKATVSSSEPNKLAKPRKHANKLSNDDLTKNIAQFISQSE